MWCPFAVQTFTRNDQFRSHTPPNCRDAQRTHGTKSPESGQSGIIAIDCSVLARPSRTLLETDSPLQAEHQMSRWLEDNVATQLQQSMSPTILGIVLFARIPAMTATGLLDANEQPYRRRDSISSILAVGNRACSDETILRDIAQRIRKQSRRDALKLKQFPSALRQLIPNTSGYGDPISGKSVSSTWTEKIA